MEYTKKNEDNPPPRQKKKKDKMVSKIYKITNMITGEFYIGCTTQSLKMRFKAHEINAKRPETKINKNIFEYGIENFKIEFVELGDQERESELIAQQRFGLCLNIQHHPKKIPPEYTEDFEEMLKR